MLLAACVTPGELTAATGVSPYISIGQIYSDNVDLNPSGNENNEYITELSPGITIDRSGSRLQALLDYRGQFFYFANRSDKKVYHQADGVASLNVVDEFLFLNGKIKATQSVVDPAGKLPTGNISRSGNTTDVYSYSIGPAIQRTFGSAALLDAKHTYRKVVYKEAGLSDSTSNKIEADVISGPGFYKMGWRVQGSWDKQKFDSGGDKDFRKATAELSYPLNRPLTYIVTAGQEDNDFGGRGASRNKPSGSIWTVGFEWVPNSRFRMNAAAGRRFFGTTVDAEMEFQGRKDQLRLSYNEDPKTVSDALTEDSGLPPGIPGNPPDINPSAPGITDEVYVRKRFRLFHMHNFVRSDFWWTGLLENREYQESSDDERVLRFDANWVWRLGVVTSLNTSGSWQERDLRDTNNDYKLWYARIGVTREFGSTSSAELDYQFSERDGDNDNNDYSENRISARLLFSF